MTNERRGKINRIIEQMNSIKDAIEAILTEEEDAYDSIPDNLKFSMRAQDSDAAIDELTNAFDSADELIGLLTEAGEKADEIIDSLDNATI